MAEKLSHQPESHEALAALPTAEQAEPLRTGEQDPAKALEKARSSVSETVEAENQPNPMDKLEADEKASQPVAPSIVDRQLKKITERRLIKDIQRKESAPQRALSKVIHQPIVRAVSETAGKTVSRPSGLLGGGLVAFLGTTGYFYLAQHIGFKYNYLVVIILMVAGFALGLILELLVNLATASRRNNS
ncbi:MAG: hypothetical protein AAB971_02900 [Patescibacteria group bacterium]